MTKKLILYIDMDNVLVDFRSALPALTREEQHTYAGQLDNIPGIFAKMQPMPGALDAYQELAQHFDTYILSTAPWENPSAWSDKLQWVKTHLGAAAYKRLILTHHKNLNRGDYLIDDRTHNGAGDFPGEHIHFGTEKYPDWQSVVTYLKKKYLATEPQSTTIDELKIDFLSLREQCMWLQNCFNTFNALYNSGQETQNLLKNTAILFFDDLHQIQQEYFFLLVRRITDPASSRKRENITINNINKKLEAANLMNKSIKKTSEQILTYRKLTENISNRISAHNDKKTILARKIVGAHTREALDNFMNNIRTYTDEVSKILNIDALDYRAQPGKGDVIDFITALKKNSR